MGSGLSMASVNKIKELASQREYSLALDIIDSQDLSKSLNSQFLRLCGEAFGSALTFGSVGAASAPGQINAEDLREILALIHANS